MPTAVAMIMISSVDQPLSLKIGIFCRNFSIVMVCVK